VLTPAKIIRSATVVGAEQCQMTGQIGTIAAGAFADLVVVGGDRLQWGRWRHRHRND
jgi:imidazolonepropionase-like amidohydrolase